jgi:trk system potassium uptake protein TrkH
MKTLPATDADHPVTRRLTLYDRMAPVINVLGVVLALFGLTMAVPFAASFLLKDGAQSDYGTALIATLASGLAMLLVTRGRQRREIQPRDGFLLVALVWTVLPAFATLPLMAHFPNLSFTDAYFETVSGLTATGATVLTGLDDFPASINLWRTLLGWLGGMGIIVLAVAVLPLLGVGGSQLFRAEMAGPMKDTRLTPRIEETAKGLWLVYFGLTGACAIAYYLAGMSGLDALMHAFTTVGLGGLSSHDSSFGFFNSPLIEAVAIVFMLLSAVNFTTHFLAFRRRALVSYLHDPEARWMAIWAVFASVLIGGHLWVHGTYDDLATSMRHEVINGVYVGKTTG